MIRRSLRLTPAAVFPGASSSSGSKFGYVVSEMSGIVNVFTWDARGSADQIQAVPTCQSHFKR